MKTYITHSEFLEMKNYQPELNVCNLYVNIFAFEFILFLVTVYS